MDTLERYTPHLDVYSIDEAFLDLSPVATLPLAQRRAYVAEMRETVGRWTGFRSRWASPRRRHWPKRRLSAPSTILRLSASVC